MLLFCFTCLCALELCCSMPVCHRQPSDFWRIGTRRRRALRTRDLIHIVFYLTSWESSRWLQSSYMIILPSNSVMTVKSALLQWSLSQWDTFLITDSAVVLTVWWILKKKSQYWVTSRTSWEKLKKISVSGVVKHLMFTQLLRFVEHIKDSVKYSDMLMFSKFSSVSASPRQEESSVHTMISGVTIWLFQCLYWLTLLKECFLRRAVTLIFGSLILIMDSYRAQQTQQTEH